ncbi:WG repeat-containing protein [Ideonella sp. DXS29W]|uniref:WG repeat-containing protein n=1 Tax=Ideonella lacteola TaxID=2984193 RepID=A0ABU9C041_9BURK
MTATLAALLLPLCLGGPGGQCGLVDLQGRWAVPPRYAKVEPHGLGFSIELDGGLAGLLDAAGQPLGTPALLDIGPLSEGLASASRAGERGLQGYVDAAGQWVIEPQFSMARAFSDGLAVVMLASSGGNNVYMRYIRRDGRFAFPQTFRDAEPFQNGLAVAALSDAGGQGVLDVQGRWVVPPRPGQRAQIRELTPAERQDRTEPLIVLMDDDRQRLLDRRGRLLYEVKGPDASIQPAGAGRAFIYRDEDHTALLDTRTGKLVQAWQAQWFSNDRFSEGRAPARQTQGPGTGYIDIHGRWALPPRWRYVHPFDDGLAVVMAVSPTAAAAAGSSPNPPTERVLQGVIDHSGRWVLPPTWERIRTRLDGAVNGELQLPRGVFEAFHADAPPAAEPPSNAAEALRAAATGWAQWPLQRTYFHQAAPGGAPRVVASVRSHPCGFQVLMDAAGQPQPPANVVGKCLLTARLDSAAQAALPASAAQALAAARQAEALQRAQWLRTVDRRDGPLGSVGDMAVQRLHPALAERQRASLEIIEHAEWLTGPADVVLDGALGIHFHVPAGVQVLRPQDARPVREALRELRSRPLPEPAALKQLDEALAARQITADEHAKQRQSVLKLFPPEAAGSAALSAEDQDFARKLAEMDMGLLRPVEGGWVASLSIQRTGAVSLRPDALDDPAELLETLKVYSNARQGDGLGVVDPVKYSSYRWVLPPRLDPTAAQFEFAFGHASLGGEAQVVYNALAFGRSHAVVIQASLAGPFRDELTQAYLPDLRQLVQQVQFMPGQGHADIHDSDARASLRLSELVTGPRPASLQRLGQAVQRIEQRQQQRAQGLMWQLGLVALVLVLAVMGVARKRG